MFPTPADPYHRGISAGLSPPANRAQASVPVVAGGLSSQQRSPISNDMPVTADHRGIPASIAMSVGGGLCVIILALIGVIYSSVAGDVNDLKSDVKEIRTSVQLLATNLGEIGKQAAVTNARLDASNEKLQTLIDETRRRPR